MTYPIETILAEKVETILRRSISNTRPRDFYDVYLIVKTQSYDIDIFYEALSSTTVFRGTDKTIKNVPEILKAIKDSPILKQQWEKYQREYLFAKDIIFENIIKILFQLLGR